MRRVFAVDVLECPDCGSRLKILAAIHPPEVDKYDKARFRSKGQVAEPESPVTDVLPTVRSRILFVFLVLSYDRRRIVHVNVTQHLSAAWTGRQLVEAFPWDPVPRYLIRDRDGIYGRDFTRCVNAFGIKQILIAPHSPWQNPFVERVIGSVRRECLDHVVIFSENHLRRALKSYLRYYHVSRTHLALGKDAPDSRSVEPPARGKVVAFPEVGGLHHRYTRRAA
jgi:hypothetical protein